MGSTVKLGESLAPSANTVFRKLSLEEIKQAMLEQGQPAFRAKQIYAWLWQHNAQSFEEMTNLPISLREKLNEYFIFLNIALDKQQISEDGTIKARFRLHDGFNIESVLIPVLDENRFTVCVSSQVGCSLTCSFCATGKMKRERRKGTRRVKKDNQRNGKAKKFFTFKKKIS